MSVYDWANAPAWASCAARDFNGFAHWFESTPELYKEYDGDLCGEWCSTSGRRSPCDPFWGNAIDAPHFTTSLEHRPVGGG